MGELDGEFAHILELGLSRALGKLLADSPFFREYEWQIISAVIGFPILWMLFRSYRKRRPAMPPSELAVEFRNFRRELWGWIRREGPALPLGLRVPIILSIVGVALAAFADMPYDFFVLLRVLVLVTCDIVLFSLWKAQSVASRFWIMAGIAVLYNPLLPIHLHRDTWGWINIATIPLLVVLCVMVRLAHPRHRLSLPCAEIKERFIAKFALGRMNGNHYR